MENDNPEHAEMESGEDLAGEEPFDREYTYQELIPVTFFQSLYDQLQGLGIESLCVALRNGSFYYTSHHLEKKVRLPEDMAGMSIITLDRWTVAVPLIHEFETHAFLIVGFFQTEVMAVDRQIALARLIGVMVDQMVTANYKTRLSSGLHSQVVEDTYQEIRKKTELLEKSEKKYRLLAESLEKEVLRKTQEVKEAQAYVVHQEKLASIGHLAAGVAHEINNPMGFISSNLRTLKDYCQDIRKAYDLVSGFIESVKNAKSDKPDKTMGKPVLSDFLAELKDLDLDYILNDIPQLLEESLDGAERINKIVSDLKDFAHPGEESACTADLVQCIESTLNIVWNELKYKTTLTRSYQPIPMINCYPRQLNQVIMNLLMNAAQAIEKMGEIEIGTRDLGNEIEFTVRDTGHGIPMEILPRIFDPFFTTKDVGKGTGLGLNLVYNIVRKHKGTIEVKSETGKGTTFFIRLPVNAQLDKE